MTTHDYEEYLRRIDRIEARWESDGAISRGDVKFLLGRARRSLPPWIGSNPIQEIVDLLPDS